MLSDNDTIEQSHVNVGNTGFHVLGITLWSRSVSTEYRYQGVAGYCDGSGDVYQVPAYLAPGTRVLQVRRTTYGVQYYGTKNIES